MKLKRYEGNPILKPREGSWWECADTCISVATAPVRDLLGRLSPMRRQTRGQ